MRPTWCCCRRVCNALKQVAKEVGLDLRGAYLNLDGGFDSAHNRKCIFNAGLIPNITENPRNRKRPKRGRKRFFNAAIHALRMRVERTFAWEDKFKRLLLRFERIQQRHYGMKLLAYTLINLRSVLRYLKLATSYILIWYWVRFSTFPRIKWCAPFNGT